MNKILWVGTFVAAVIATTSAFAEKTYIQLDECLTPDIVVENVVSNVPDATFTVYENTLVFTSPTKPGSFTTYFDENGCYEAYEVIDTNA